MVHKVLVDSADWRYQN